MTDLGRLVDRTLLVGFEEPDPPDWLRRVAPHLGGIVLYGQNLRRDADCPRLAGILAGELGGLVAVDEEGGDVTRMHYRNGSPTPGNYVLGAADDLAGTAAVAGRIGALLRAADIRWNLAPDADVNSNPDNPVIGVRSFGADPELVSRHTAAWVRGLQRQGVAGCAKHFPGHGDTHADSHLELPTVDCAEAQWRRLHLPPFVAAFRAGVRSIMTAHIRLPALDDAPATLSRRILVDLLRGELGFDGVIVTDALDMAAVAGTHGRTGGAVAALVAGADALCLGSTGGEELYRTVRAGVLAAVRDGVLPAGRVEEAAERVSRLHAWTASAVPDGAPGTGPGVDLVRRAVLTRGVTPLRGRPVVIEMRDTPNLAVGEAAWDLGGPLRDLGHPPVLTARITGVDNGLDAIMAGSGGYPLVVVGRDVVRHPWQRAVWAAVRAARADAVLVDLGLPRPADLGDGPYVLVGGAARPNLRAAAEVLATGLRSGVDGS